MRNFNDPTDMTPYLVDGAYPDPFVTAGRYLHAREAEWRQAHREMGEACVFYGAEMLRNAWPTAHRVIFDRTENDAHPLKPMTFLRIEDMSGTTLATRMDLPADEESDVHGVVIALHYLLRAEGEINTAGGVGLHRPWFIESTYSFEYDARPPYTCTVTLPPAVRPAGDRTALLPNAAMLRGTEAHAYGRERNKPAAPGSLPPVPAAFAPGDVLRIRETTDVCHQDSAPYEQGEFYVRINNEAWQRHGGHFDGTCTSSDYIIREYLNDGPERSARLGQFEPAYVAPDAILPGEILTHAPVLSPATLWLPYTATNDVARLTLVRHHVEQHAGPAAASSVAYAIDGAALNSILDDLVGNSKSGPPELSRRPESGALYIRRRTRWGKTTVVYVPAQD
ncbi:hypothetical protein [Streptomyces sp. NEAU-174]|uniref:hypothetical protein n=1 Tax=Streptomyces sp. NEAU-174 TaxID=3458254 RepID=UPI004044FF69